jgi:hypothetical protein
MAAAQTPQQRHTRVTMHPVPAGWSTAKEISTMGHPVIVKQGKSTTPFQRFNRRKLALLNQAREAEARGNTFMASRLRGQAQAMAAHAKRAQADASYASSPIHVKEA